MTLTFIELSTVYIKKLGKWRWYRARFIYLLDLFESQIPMTTGGFELQISCICGRSYSLMG